MKKLVLIGLLTCLLFVGCGKKLSSNEKVMKEYATTYYNAHKKGSVDVSSPKVSIKDLKSGNEYAGDNFDLTKLSKCKDTSYVELTIDSNTRDITKYTFHMECE